MSTEDMSRFDSIEADVAVIGGGGTGLAAAAAAAERGKRVVLLEKRPGGNSALAQGIFAAETRLQKELRVDVPRDKAFQTAIEYSHWKINPRIIRAYIDKSADTVDWLETRGLIFDSLRDVYAGQLRGFHCMMPPRQGGADIIKTLRQYSEELGVKIFVRCPVKEILKNKAGQICGVLASKEGKKIYIKTGSVILATGGYGGNKRLLKKYYPSYNDNIYLVGVPNMGDGLLMAIKAGAATEGLGNMLLHHLVCPGSDTVGAVIRDPASIWLNKLGERFTDETVGQRSIECGNVLDRQPDKIAYALIDENIKNRILEAEKSRRIPRSGAAAGTNMGALDSEFQKVIDKGGAKISSSWTDIAGWIGINNEKLSDAVAEYNRSCELGYDAVFNKGRRYLQALQTPPYYAVRCHLSLMTTIGGIKINERMEVIDTADKVIPGLYAGGDCAGGWESESYCMVLAGSAFGFALNSGRIAGENAAEYCSRYYNFRRGRLLRALS